MWLHDCEKFLKIHYVIRFDRICLHIGYVTDGHSDTARRIGLPTALMHSIAPQKE